LMLGIFLLRDCPVLHLGFTFTAKQRDSLGPVVFPTTGLFLGSVIDYFVKCYEPMVERKSSGNLVFFLGYRERFLSSL
jgi:hypothetical protein